MSFILDALRKAEEARHPTAVSPLGRVRVPRLVPHRVRWPWIVGGALVLAVNAGVLGYLLWPRDAGQTDNRPDAATQSAV